MRHCFIVGPIGSEGSPTRARADKLLNDVIKPVLEEFGYDAVRADTLHQSGLITNGIIRAIVDSDLVIADLSERNPNAYYELALAHAAVKPYIQVINRGEALPFDLAPFNTVQVDLSSDQGIEAAREAIGKLLEGLADRGALIENPITVAMGRKGLLQSGDKALPFSELRAALEPYLDGFAGSLDIYNVELNTLNDAKLWQLLCQPASVKGIRVFVAPHVFKRMERKLASNAEVADLMETYDQATKGEFRIYPVQVPKDRLAFAVFDPEAASPKHREAYLFPKIDPFSCWVEARSRDEAFQDYGHWDYKYFFSSCAPTLLNELMGILQRLRDGPYYSPADLRGFFSAAPLSREEVLRRHALEPDQEADRLLQELVFEPQRENSKPIGSLPVNKARDRSPLSLKDELQPVEYSCGSRKAYLSYYNTKPRGKPLLLWVPPWGIPSWFERTKQLDEKLTERFVVGHLQYSDAPRDYTFSSAERDIRYALREIWEGPRVFGRSAKSNRTDIILVGVSVNAFVAAQVAANCGARLAGVCLLAPAVDLFDALDSFRGIQLFSRAFHFAKAGYTASQIPEIQYFGKSVRTHHLLDLGVRGAATCGKRGFSKCIDDLAALEVPLCIGLSRRDQMTSFNDVEALCLEKRVPLLQIDWYHDLDPAPGAFRCNMPVDRFDEEGSLIKQLFEMDTRRRAALQVH